MSYEDPNALEFIHSAVLIAAHGSPSNGGGPNATRRHAEHLASLNIFGEVGAGFLTEKPFVADVLNGLESNEIYIVPNMATSGYVCQEKLPQALGLTGHVTERITSKGHQRLILTEPVGTHPLMAKIMASSVEIAMKDLHLDGLDTALVVIGHGSTKSRASFTELENVNAELSQFGLSAFGKNQAISCAFLEETPFIKDWRELTEASTIIFAPYLISDGFHATQDIPLAIGFDPGEPSFLDTLAKGMAATTEVDGRRLVYLPPVGMAPYVAEIIVARVKQAHAQLSDR
jgi:sirohydrochlorin cobaltochelatase